MVSDPYGQCLAYVGNIRPGLSHQLAASGKTNQPATLQKTCRGEINCKLTRAEGRKKQEHFRHMNTI